MSTSSGGPYRANTGVKRSQESYVPGTRRSTVRHTTTRSTTVNPTVSKALWAGAHLTAAALQWLPAVVLDRRVGILQPGTKIGIDSFTKGHSLARFGTSVARTASAASLAYSLATNIVRYGGPSVGTEQRRSAWEALSFAPYGLTGSAACLGYATTLASTWNLGGKSSILLPALAGLATTSPAALTALGVSVLQLYARRRA